MSYPSIAPVTADVVAALNSPSTSYIATATVTMWVADATQFVDDIGADNITDEQTNIGIMRYACLLCYATIFNKAVGFATDKELSNIRANLQFWEDRWQEWLERFGAADIGGTPPAGALAKRSTYGHYDAFEDGANI